MTKRILSLIVILALTFSFNDATSMDFIRKNKVRGCVTHVLNYGEDLTSLLKRYEIRLDDLKQYNPNIEDELKVGQPVYVPRKKVRKATKEQIDSDIENFLARKEKEKNEKIIIKQKKENDNVDAPSRMIEHEVKANETFYSIGKLYGIEVETIRLYNPTVSVDDMSIGTILNIPQRGVDTETETGKERVVAEAPIEDFEETMSFSSKDNSVVKVSLILPIKSEKGQSMQFTDFYQGFLMGLDSLKDKGVSIEMNIINLEKDSPKLNQIVNSNSLSESNIVIGPVYDEQFSVVAHALSDQNIPIISPLGAVGSNEKNVFQVAPHPATKYDKLRDSLSGKNIVLLSSNSDDKEFVDKMTEFAANQIQIVPFNVKKEAKYYADDLPINKATVYLMAATNPMEADAIISKIGAIKEFGLGRDITTIATSRVARLTNINPALLFDASVSYVTSYHADRTNYAVRKFDSKYMKSFGKMPTLYSYRGYDVAMVFIGSMSEFGSSFREYIANYYMNVLQVMYLFKHETPSGKLVNSQWMLIDYKPSFEIEVK